MKDFWKEQPIEKPNLNKKKLAITIIIVILIIALISITIVYFKNNEARKWIDKNILRKEVMQDRVTTIELKEENITNVYAFNKYIGLLNKNKFSIYDSTGNEEKNLDIEITNPLFSSANRFLAIAETKGQKIYLIEAKEIVWENTVDGNISQVHVNKNGYVAVTIVDTSYKTVIEMFDPTGTEMFNSYLSFTRVADVSISNDNKYLAIAEIDTSGTMIKSNVKILSVEKASTGAENELEYTYTAENNKLIVNVKYQDKNRLVCMYTDEIRIIEENKNDVLLFENQDKKVIFETIELNNNAIIIEEKSSGLFTADSVVTIKDTEKKDFKEYIVNSVTKDLYTYGDTIALNLGTEIEFINTSGLLRKRYIANQEITNVVLSENIAGIIYRDKIEIVNL